MTIHYTIYVCVEYTVCWILYLYSI